MIDRSKLERPITAIKDKIKKVKQPGILYINLKS